MSIAPPSDIVLDVAQAADPQRLQEAQSKLARMASGISSTSFSSVLGAPSAKPGPPVQLAQLPSSTAISTRATSPYQKFEAVLLQNLMINILPKDNELFGDAASADINRSMLAEQLANQIAKSNRIGIASMIEKAHGAPHAPVPGAAPLPGAVPLAGAVPQPRAAPQFGAVPQSGAVPLAGAPPQPTAATITPPADLALSALSLPLTPRRSN